MTHIPSHLENRCIAIISANFLESYKESYGSNGEHKRLHSAINMYDRYSFTSLFELAIPNNQEPGILHVIYLLYSVFSCYK